MDIFGYSWIICDTTALKGPDPHAIAPLPVKGPLAAPSVSTIGYMEVYDRGMKSAQG